MLGAFWMVWVVLAIVVYVFVALALMTIAQKRKVENAWLAWIPIANIYLMTQIAGVPAWWTALVLLPIVPMIGSLAMMAAFAYLWWLICEKLGKPGWWGIVIAVVPLVNLVFLGALVWGKK